MINYHELIQLLWNTHVIDTTIRYICYYLIFLIIFSELSSFIRDGFLMTLSRAFFAIGCYFVATSTKQASSHLFATAVLTMLIGVTIWWSLYVIRAVYFGKKTSKKSILQSLINCPLLDNRLQMNKD